MQKFTCAPQTYQARPGAGFVTGLYTFPHGLGGVPRVVRVFFECLVAEHGYSVGDMVNMNSHMADRIGSGVPGEWVATGFGIKSTASEIELSFDTNHGASVHQFDMKRNKRLNNNAWAIWVKVYDPEAAPPPPT